MSSKFNGLKFTRQVLCGAFAGLVLLTTACGDKGTDSAKGTDSEIKQEVGAAEFSYTLPGKFVNWINDLKWMPELMKETGANVEFVNGGDGELYYKNIDLKVGSGKFSDVGMVQLSQAEVYGTKGAFVDLTPYITQYAPNIKKYMDDHPEYTQLITSSDGKIYALLPQTPKTSIVTFYREDMFQKAGISELPKTIDEFTEALRKLKAAYPDNKNFYPLGGRDNFLRYQSAFEANDRVDAEGKVHGLYNVGQNSDLKAPGFKKLIEWYIQLYNEKLVDPEWISGLAKEENWQTKVLNNDVAISNEFYTRPSWFMMNGGQKTDPNFKMNVMPPFITDSGVQSKFPTAPEYKLDRAFVINAKSADKAPAILNFLDYLYTDKGQTFLGWGIEGTTYKKNTDGNNEFIVDFEEESTKPLGTRAWTFFQDRMTFPVPANNEAFYQFNADFTKSFASDYFSKYTESFPILNYSTDQLKERSNFTAKVNEALMSNLVKFVTGKRSMSEWDVFMKEMDDLGYSKILEIDQAAYDAVTEK